MPKYRKKPVDVEMFQWRGDLAALDGWINDLLATWMDEVPRDGDFSLSSAAGGLNFFCSHGQSTVIIAEGDWIAVEAAGDGFYPILDADKRNSYEQGPIVDAE